MTTTTTTTTTTVNKTLHIDLTDYYHDIHSRYGEDGILFCIFRLIGLYRPVSTFLNLSDARRKENMFMNLIKMFGFVSARSMSCPLDLTLQGVKDMKLRFDDRPLDLLFVCAGDGSVEYWLTKTVVQDNGWRPNVLVVRVNHVVGTADESVTVPYTHVAKRATLFDEEYYGTSAKALDHLLGAEYTRAGFSRYGKYAFYVKTSLIPAHVRFGHASNPFPHTYDRWSRLKRTKFWVRIANNNQHLRH